MCVEFDHLESEEERDWLYKSYERMMGSKLTNAEKVNINNFLVQSEAIDHYMHKKFTTFVSVGQLIICRNDTRARALRLR